MTRHDETHDTDTPAFLGPYRILDRIGEGGMGEVFVAEQTEPVRRRVALKLIKLGMDTREVIARFEGERQALALMSHPSIARIYDAGATEPGRPYFVMEYIAGGQSLVEHCDAKRLGTRARLRLFQSVCSAIQHAHTKGLIHRDIKPGNILVTEESGEPVPKVIDFGIAKATDQRLTDATVQTELGRAVGTPEYMSPEQADPTVLDVDTRSDVYSLGVVLYELLVGARPHAIAQAAPGVALLAFLRMLRDVDPEPPSTRVSKLGPGAERVATQRGASLRELARTLRGELDWIVMRALAKAPADRYQSAAELADDIERHLRGLAVQASPPSTTYRLRKTLLRHRLAFGFAATVFVLLTALAVVSTVQARRIEEEAERARAESVRAGELAAEALTQRERANQERDRANEQAREAHAERDRANREAERAQREARQAHAVTQFLTGIFTLADPNEAPTITARELLERGASQLTEHLDTEPRAQSVLCNRIGRVLFDLGLYESATPLLESAVELLEGLEDVNDGRRAMHLTDLGLLYRTLARYDEAEPLLLEGLRLQEAAQPYDPLAIAATLNTLGSLCVYADRFEEGIEYHERALELEREHRDPDDVAMELTYNNLAAAQYELGRHADAADNFAQALRLLELEPSMRPDAVYVYNNLAYLSAELGREEQAEAAFLRALDLCAEHYGPSHEVVGAAAEGLGRLWVEREPMPPDTEAVLRRGVEARRALYGAGTRLHAQTLAVLARYLVRAGRLEEARAALDDVLPVLRRSAGSDPAAWEAARLDAIDLDLRAGEVSEQSLEWIDGHIAELRGDPEQRERMIEALELFARMLAHLEWFGDVEAVEEELEELRAGDR